jgi:hypothetical protein
MTSGFLTNHSNLLIMYYTINNIMAVWPSGKAVDCKSSIPSSNLGAALFY